MEKEREKGIKMQISPISLYSLKNNNVQNTKTNNPSFKSGYSLVNTPYGSSCPIEVSRERWREQYGSELPPLEYFVELNRQNGTGYGSSTPHIRSDFSIDYGRFHFDNLDNVSISSMASQLHEVSDGEIRDFLFEATVKEPKYASKTSYKHISHYFKNMTKGEGDKWAMKGLLDRAISGPAWAEEGSHVAANSAYLISWYKDFLPESTKNEYSVKMLDFIEQAQRDLNNPTWSPREAYDSYKAYSGPDYSSNQPQHIEQEPKSKPEIYVHFIPYGPREPEIQRIMKEYGVSREEAEKAIQAAADRYSGCA